MKCAIFLAKGFEDCEALITIDMLRRASVEVDSVSITDDLRVTASHGVTMFADRLWKDIDPKEYDVLILPGGRVGTENLEAFKPLISALEEHWKCGRLICAICAAPSILGHLGILKGRHYTCFPSFASDEYGGIYEMELAVEDGNVITGRGMGATIEFARTIIRRLTDEYGGIYEMELTAEDGNVITGRGMGATIEFARTIIRRLTDEKTMRKLEYGMQYEHSFRSLAAPE